MCLEAGAVIVYAVDFVVQNLTPRHDPKTPKHLHAVSDCERGDLHGSIQDSVLLESPQNQGFVKMDEAAKDKLQRMGILSGIAIALHNIPSGIATFTAEIEDPAIGASMAISVGLHNIAEGIAIAAPVCFATGSKRKAVMCDGHDPGQAILCGIVAGMMATIAMKEIFPTAYTYANGRIDLVSNGGLLGMVLMALNLWFFKHMGIVVTDFLQYLEDPDVAVAVAVIKALTRVILHSEATTMMQMEGELQGAAQQLRTFQAADDQTLTTRFHNSIATTAGCQLFLRYVTRCFLEFDDFDLCRSQLIDRGKLFAETSLSSRQRISDVGHNFIRDGMKVLTHGKSRVVIALLREAAKSKNFSVFVTEGKSTTSGVGTAKELAQAGIPTTVILDSAVAYYMEQVDIVIVGAEGVVENGGIVNSIGTYSTAVIAQALKKQFYVAAESYKFARLYPLTQRDLPQKHMAAISGGELTDVTIQNVSYESPFFDYTPPGYIALMFTDLGVLTPSAVSDELIKLYQ
ncbi:unnamed protein product [Peronospora belbahrii]|uniref:Translation initiation factor eIF2B subunit alpha n=1 Tax=Peronospora belbahrii TaxID=622444 RepID=A0AAU9L5A6_9STRA|nr:unnamed protein product [Peronospora belbahrii]